MSEEVKSLERKSVLKSVLYIVLGIAAIVLADSMARMLTYIIGGILLALGIVAVILYFTREVTSNFFRNDFLLGMAAIAIGFVLIIKVDLILAVLPTILGVAVIISGCNKLQNVITLARMKNSGWIAVLVLALITIVIGLVLVIDPFGTEKLLAIVLGIGLIFGGLTDLMVTLYLKGKLKKDVQTVTYEEVSSVPADEQ